MLSAALIAQLDKDEPPIRIKPGMERDTIMYRAGRLSIIEELKIRQDFTQKREIIIFNSTEKGK